MEAAISVTVGRGWGKAGDQIDLCAVRYLDLQLGNQNGLKPSIIARLF